MVTLIAVPATAESWPKIGPHAFWNSKVFVYWRAITTAGAARST
jgi:hypothetical protein